MYKILLATLIVCGLTASAARNASAQDGWIRQIGGKGADLVYDVTETSDGHICATGTFWAGSRFGAGDRERTLTSDAAHDIFVACYRSDGALVFARQFGAARGDEPRAIAALPGGDVVVTGLLADDETHANGNADIFVARVNTRGGVVWLRQYGGKRADSGNALAVSPNGDIYVAGSFDGLMTWHADGKIPTVNSAGARDALVMKLSADNGSIEWARPFGGPRHDEATAISASREGGVIVGGAFRDVARFGASGFGSRGFNDIFVASLDADGALRWARQFGGTSQESLHGLAEDSRGRIHLTGNFQGAFVVDDARLLESAGSTDVFVVRLDADGAPQHAASFGGALTDQVFAIDVTASDGLFLAGHYQGDTDIAPGNDVVRLAAPAPGNSSGYLLTLNSRGNYVKADTIGGAGMKMALGMRALTDGGVAVVGLYNDDLSVPSLTPLDNRGKTDVFVTRLPPVMRAQMSRANASAPAGVGR